MSFDPTKDDLHYSEVVHVTLHRLYDQLISVCGTDNANKLMDDIETIINYVDLEARKEEREEFLN